ncbi:small integral membrane protein 24 [Chroicocephalus ridibundus]|uniref:small integral membrane protein 24 n=1 Tax=Chroicocephalus ridibundus TaxID=1192867 RepID=UPI002FDD2C9D
MPRAPQPLSLLVLLVLAATAQGQAGTGPKELQPWLLGLTAVVVFLFIVFVLLLVNRLWQIRMRRKRGDVQDTPGTDRLERTGRANPAAEKDSDEESDGEERSKATSF